MHNITILVRYGQGGVGLTGWGWITAWTFVILAGRS